MAGEKWELFNPTRTYCPEADTPIWEYIEGSHPSRRLTAAFWGGGIDEEVMQALPVPPFTRKKCYIEFSSHESSKKVTTDGNVETHNSRSQAI